MFGFSSVERAVILPHGDEEGVVVFGQFGAWASHFAGARKALLSLLPPTEILVVLVGTAAEFFLIFGGDVFTIGVGGCAPLGKFRPVGWL